MNEAVDEYNSTPHSSTGFPPKYLMLSISPKNDIFPDNYIYPPIEETCKQAFEKNKQVHFKNKERYDKNQNFSYSFKI